MASAYNRCSVAREPLDQVRRVDSAGPRLQARSRGSHPCVQRLVGEQSVDRTEKIVVLELARGTCRGYPSPSNIGMQARSGASRSAASSATPISPLYRLSRRSGSARTLLAAWSESF